MSAYDRRILTWLAGFEPQAAAAVARIINRAATWPPHEVAFDVTVGDSAYLFLNESPEGGASSSGGEASNDLAHLVEALSNCSPS